MDYETAMNFVIELRPHLAVVKADHFARKLQILSANANQAGLELRQIALANQEVVDYLKSDKKIQAIKTLRTANECTLKEAKDAVESPELLAKLGLRMSEYGHLVGVPS